MGLKAVIFDKDGVITDNNAFHKQAWFVFFEKYGVLIPEEEFEARVYGKTNEVLLDDLYQGRLSPEEINDLSEEKEQIFRDLYEAQFELMPGLIPFLHALKDAGIKTAVATNAPKVNLDFTLDKGALHDYFTGTYYAHLVENPKPAPDLYLFACQQLGVEPSEALVFEDSLTGMDAALAAGCKLWGIASTYTPEVLYSRTQLVTKDFTEVTLPKVAALWD